MLKLITTFWAVAVFATTGTALANDTDILSKEDAAIMFKVSKSQWNTNVGTAVRAGVAKATKSSDGTLTQYVFGDGTILGVRPLYTDIDNNIPSALMVSSSYRSTHPFVAAYNSDISIGAAVCKKAADQMYPEFAVSCNHSKMGDGVMFMFTIRDNRKD